MCISPLFALKKNDGTGVKFFSRDYRESLYGNNSKFNRLKFELDHEGKIMDLPCRNCISCRLNYTRNWAVRIMHESKLWDSNEFVTLTYNNDNLPENQNLNYRDVQLFLKRLRKKYSQDRIRFVCAGEYGEQLGRPHYHLIIFNMFFADRKKRHTDLSNYPHYTSQILSDLWGLGHSVIGTVTPESASYVSGYIMKKINGQLKAQHYQYVNIETGEIVTKRQEFFTMSRRPGIASNWFDQFHRDVFPSDEVFYKGKSVKPPPYYFNLLQKKDLELFEKIKEIRYNDMQDSWELRSPYHLNAKKLKLLNFHSKKERIYEQQSRAIE